jgi:hypothetical protein
MKKLKLVFLLFALVLVSNTIFAQVTPKVIAVISKAKWCPTCIKNENRVGQEVIPTIDATKITLVINDLSDKQTKVASAESLNGLGLKQGNFKSTGVITFIDAVSKKIISTISVAESSDKIKEAFANSLQ